MTLYLPTGSPTSRCRAAAPVQFGLAAHQKRKTALPGGKAAYVARWCMAQPNQCKGEKGVSVWLEAAWGHWLEVLGRDLQGYLGRCERSVDWRGEHSSTDQKTNPDACLRLFEQAPESQPASAICCGGVSAVMGSSDLVGLNFPPLKLLLTSVESRIALEDETAESGAGLPERGARMNVQANPIGESDNTKEALRARTALI